MVGTIFMALNFFSKKGSIEPLGIPNVSQSCF